GRNSAFDGRQPDALLGGRDRALGAGSADYRDHAIVVSGSGLAAARPSPHFLAGQGRPGAGYGGITGFILAGTAFDVSPGAARAVGVSGLDWGIVPVGARIGIVEALAVRDGRIQRDGLADNGGGGGELFVRARPGRFLASCVDDPRGGCGALSRG